MGAFFAPPPYRIGLKIGAGRKETPEKGAGVCKTSVPKKKVLPNKAQTEKGSHLKKLLRNKEKAENQMPVKMKKEHMQILVVVGAALVVAIIGYAIGRAGAPAAASVQCPTTAPSYYNYTPHAPTPAPTLAPTMAANAAAAAAASARATAAEAAARGKPGGSDPLEQSFADVATTVLKRAGVDDRINPAISTKNGGMLPILDVRGDYDALMPFEDARCDENGKWNQSSKQQSIRLGLITDVMKRRLVVV